MSTIGSFKGKAVMVTGGANGIGLALAEAFLEAGAHVYIADLDALKIAAESARLSNRGKLCKAGVCDVTDASSVAAALERAWSDLGPVDLLCANAGVVKTGPMLTADPADVQWQFNVNVFGMLNTIRAFVARLREARRPGHILVTGSETGLSNPAFVRPFRSHAYTVTKHAVFGLADVLREELKPDQIGISMLCPGPVATNLAHNSARLNPNGGSDVAPDLNVSEAVMAEVVGRMKPASQIADIALEGLRRGLFIIPTHAHISEDVNERYLEIMRGFEVLG